MYSCLVCYIFLISVEKNFSPEVLQIILNEPYAGSDDDFHGNFWLWLHEPSGTINYMTFSQR